MELLDEDVSTCFTGVHSTFTTFINVAIDTYIDTEMNESVAFKVTFEEEVPCNDIRVRFVIFICLSGCGFRIGGYSDMTILFRRYGSGGSMISKRRGTNPRVGVPAQYFFTSFPRKLHENDQNWTLGAGHQRCGYVSLMSRGIRHWKSYDLSNT